MATFSRSIVPGNRTVGDTRSRAGIGSQEVQNETSSVQQLAVPNALYRGTRTNASSGPSSCGIGLSSLARTPNQQALMGPSKIRRHPAPVLEGPLLLGTMKVPPSSTPNCDQRKTPPPPSPTSTAPRAKTTRGPARSIEVFVARSPVRPTPKTVSTTARPVAAVADGDRLSNSTTSFESAGTAQPAKRTRHSQLPRVRRQPPSASSALPDLDQYFS